MPETKVKKIKIDCDKCGGHGAVFLTLVRSGAVEVCDECEGEGYTLAVPFTGRKILEYATDVQKIVGSEGDTCTFSCTYEKFLKGGRPGLY